MFEISDLFKKDKLVFIFKKSMLAPYGVFLSENNQKMREWELLMSVIVKKNKKKQVSDVRKQLKTNVLNLDFGKILFF